MTEYPNSFIEVAWLSFSSNPQNECFGQVTARSYLKGHWFVSSCAFVTSTPSSQQATSFIIPLIDFASIRPREIIASCQESIEMGHEEDYGYEPHSRMEMKSTHHGL